jgi:DNA mismatch endonuclease, patch repair protein
MSRIRAKDTKPELIVRRTCHNLGLRFRLHRKDLPGKPDLVFPKHNALIFVHGCFWHKHNCRYGKVRPKTNTEFWNSKRQRTVERDNLNKKTLKDRGWKVMEIWECEVKKEENLKSRILRMFNHKT